MENLEPFFRREAPLHMRRNGLLLVLRTGKWKKLPALLNACADDHAKLSTLAWKELHRWFFAFNRSFVEPTQFDLERIRSALRLVAPRLPHGAAAELQHCLKNYG